MIVAKRWTSKDPLIIDHSGYNIKSIKLYFGYGDVDEADKIVISNKKEILVSTFIDYERSKREFVVDTDYIEIVITSFSGINGFVEYEARPKIINFNTPLVIE